MGRRGHQNDQGIRRADQRCRRKGNRRVLDQELWAALGATPCIPSCKPQVSVFAWQAGKRALPSPLVRKKLTEVTLVCRRLCRRIDRRWRCPVQHPPNVTGKNYGTSDCIGSVDPSLL